MSRRKKFFLLVFVLLILMLLLFWWFLRDRPSGEFHEAPKGVVPVEEPAAVPVPSVEERQQARSGELGLRSLAMTFVERYGSYSSENPFANVQDVLPLMSARFASRSQASAASVQGLQTFIGVSTRVLSARVLSIEEAVGAAQIRVSTQREKAVDSPQKTTLSYEDMVLTFVKEGGIWKVDSAAWQ